MYLMYKKSSTSDGMSGEPTPNEAILLFYKEIKEIRDELANMNCVRSLMTKQEVADAFKVTVRTVENLVSKRELFPIMVGSLPRFTIEEVQRYLRMGDTSNRSLKAS
jgi:excisionase family DNA binding protein